MTYSLGKSRQRYLHVLILIFGITFLFLFIFNRNVYAYDQLGSGICECNSCDDCELAIADDVNCTSTVRLTTDISNEANTCINSPDGNNKTFDCQNHTIDGMDNGAGISFSGTPGGDNIVIQNCVINDFDAGMLLIDGNSFSIFQNTITSCRQGLRLLRNDNLVATSNIVDDCSDIGIDADQNTVAVFTGNTVTNIIYVSEPASYYISQYQNGSWKDIAVKHFTPDYQRQSFLVSENSNELRLKFVQKNTDFGDIESIKLYACGRYIQPQYARYLETGISILDDIIDDDLNVVVAHDMPIEVSWSLPPLCSFPLVVSLNANEYGKGFPLQFPYSPEREFASYKMGINDNVILGDGKISEDDKLNNSLYETIWKPTTGHPEGITYIYISDDKENVYFTFDVTSDNTNEYGEDWIEIDVLNNKKYRIDDFNNLYGKCGFGNTDKVSYKHQICEFLIPKSEIGYSDFKFKVRYYGTAAVGAPGTGIHVTAGGQTFTGNTSRDNSGYGVFIDNGLGGTITVNSNTACGNTLGDIYGYDKTPTVSGDNNECDVATDWNDTETTGCTNVCDDTPPVFVQIPGSSQVINLTDGQIVTINPFTIQVKPQDPESGITTVEFYIDGVLICTVTTPDANGVYSCDWDTSLYHSDVRVVAYNGNSITGEFTLSAFVELPATGQEVASLVILGALIILASLMVQRVKPNLKNE